ncbi:MAG: hypothetical protein ABSG16_19045 [Candidatus Acidiferrum sp.]
MRFLPNALVLAILATPAHAPAAPAQQPNLSASQETPLPGAARASDATLLLPAGTKVILALTGPVWAKTAHIGDPVYGVSAFPVSIHNTMAIPPGTYVAGQIDFITRPTPRTHRAEFRMHFTEMVFANGYSVELPVAAPGTAARENAAAKDALAALVQDEVPAINATATAAVHVDVYFTSDILLDSGSQIEMDLASPLSLDAANVAAAAQASRPPQLLWTSATRCRPVAGTPGSPGTPATVIPGTPSTTVPGGPGMPDITIPGTPSTVIPGTPGTPGTPGIYCPGPPSVISESGDIHKESFKLSGNVTLSGQPLAKGAYEATWQGPGPSAQVQILQKGKLVATVPAQVATLLEKSRKSQVDLGADVAPSVLAIEFKGKTFALTFDPGSQQNLSQTSARTLDHKQ